jgi:hypothetical protein
MIDDVVRTIRTNAKGFCRSHAVAGARCLVHWRIGSYSREELYQVEAEFDFIILL